jgi:diketogulonate reductase-like aldo/keto reductase
MPRTARPGQRDAKLPDLAVVRQAMERRAFGSTGVSIPLIGQGTWEMERDRAASVAALRRGIELGMTHIDTAEMYGDGACEDIVGEAIAGRRDEVFVASKVLPDNATYAGTIRACERSLKRLRTDHIDLYLLHWRESRPLEPTLRAFEQLVADGKIRCFGVSNFDVDDIEEAVAIAGAGRIACNQVLYHLGERAIEHAVIPACERHGIAVVAYSPLGQGGFPPRGKAGKALAEVARARGATPAQVALRFLTRRPSVVAIPKAARIDHVEDVAAAGRIAPLAGAEVAALEAAFPLGRSRALPML